MFGYGSSGGGNAFPSGQRADRKKSRKESSPSLLDLRSSSFSPELFAAAVDGPPSPEQLRAYTESMKRSSLFGNNSTTQTVSSTTPSLRSHESADLSDHIMSRTNSVKSTGSSRRRDRPESINIFGRGIFSKAGKRLRRDTGSVSGASSPHLLGVQDGGSPRTSYFGKEALRPKTSSNPSTTKSRKNSTISGPYNFQHVTHTQQEHVRNIEETTPWELVSERQDVRESQVANGLKGIRARDLMFDNFSLVAAPPDTRPLPPITPGSPPSPRTRVSNPQNTPPRRHFGYSQSHDNLRAPPRPPRSPPRSPPAQILPNRASSRAAHTFLNPFHPDGELTYERPRTNDGSRRPSILSRPLPSPPAPGRLPPPPNWHEEDLSHAVTTPGEEAWPLPSPYGSIVSDLADVPEEDEVATKGRSSSSISSVELRQSQSVPGLRMTAQYQERPETGMSGTLGRTPSNGTTTAFRPRSPGFNFGSISWEDAIDYCYDHEAEADCEYEWERRSLDKGSVEPSRAEASALGFHLDDDRTAYKGRFRPSLLKPSSMEELPELSPMSLSGLSNASSGPATPSLPLPLDTDHFLGHLRSTSHASSFRESQGFHLSPELLIPSDFASQMDDDLSDSCNEEAYQEDNNPSTAMSDYNDEASTASYRSSNFSRGSGRSRSTARTSQDSVFFPKHAGSSSSLAELSSTATTTAKPELAVNTSYEDVLNVVSSLKLEDDDSVSDMSIASFQPRRKFEAPRKGLNFFAPPPPSVSVPPSARNTLLSPVEEDFPGSPALQTSLPSVDSYASPPASVQEFPLRPNSGFKGPMENSHERKVSAPIEVNRYSEVRMRARANTGTLPAMMEEKRRGSYNLFPAAN